MNSYLIKLFPLLVVLSLPIFFSCSKDSDSDKTLDIDIDIVTFQPGGDTKSFNISTIEEWYVTCAGLDIAYGANFASTNWFDISPVYGVGNAQISITTKSDSHNNSIVLHIKYGKKEKKVTLHQE